MLWPWQRVSHIYHPKQIIISHGLSHYRIIRRDLFVPNEFANYYISAATQILVTIYANFSGNWTFLTNHFEYIDAILIVDGISFAH